jgi:hypothetical protein
MEAYETFPIDVDILDTITPRVAAGVALLDSTIPNWRMIALDNAHRNQRQLIMSSCSSCVLGLVFGGYGTGLARLFPNLEQPCGPFSYGHGFTVEPDLTDYEEAHSWRALEYLWLKELKKKSPTKEN